MTAAERAKLGIALLEAGAEVEVAEAATGQVEKATVPTFNAPMVVPGISKEEPMPTLPPVSIAPPAGGRPRSAELKKKIAPITIECLEIVGAKCELNGAGANAEAATLEPKPETPNAEMHVGLPKVSNVDKAVGLPAEEKGKDEANAKLDQAAATTEIVGATDAKAESSVTEEKVVKDKADAERAKAEIAVREGNPGTPNAEMHIGVLNVKTEIAEENTAETAIVDKTDASKTVQYNTVSSEPVMAEHAEVVSEK